LWEIIGELYESEPSKSIFLHVDQMRVVLGDKPGFVCPTSIVDPFCDRLLLYETSFEKYGVDLFSLDSFLVEALAIINTTRNQYDEFQYLAKHGNK